jgi:hypothetical protein
MICTAPTFKCSLLVFSEEPKYTNVDYSNRFSPEDRSTYTLETPLTLLTSTLYTDIRIESVLVLNASSRGQDSGNQLDGSMGRALQLAPEQMLGLRFVSNSKEKYFHVPVSRHR